MTKWWLYKTGYIKLIRPIFSYHTKRFANKDSSKFWRLSQQLFIFEFQYQNNTKWLCHQWLGLNLLKPRSFLGIIPKALHRIRITKSKVINVQITVTKWEKTKNLEKIFWVAKRGNKGIKNLGTFYGLQIGVRGITNRGSFSLGISNRGKKIANRTKDFKSVQRLQIRATRISNQGRDYNSVQKTLLGISIWWFNVRSYYIYLSQSYGGFELASSFTLVLQAKCERENVQYSRQECLYIVDISLQVSGEVLEEKVNI